MRALPVAVFLSLCSAVAGANPSVKSKPSNDLELTATIEPDMLKVSLELHNTGTKPITVRSYINAGERHYDPFEITLEWPGLDAAKACTKRNHLDLKLSDNRKKSAAVNETIEPGHSLVHEIDVPAWAKRAVNGATVLGGGYYKVTARYRVSGEKALWNGLLETPALRVVALDQARTDMCKPAAWDTW
jgi:hypothetical protein